MSQSDGRPPDTAAESGSATEIEGETAAETETAGCVRVGITGHLDLTAATERRVRAELRRYLAGLHEAAAARSCDLVGVTCLARGADSVFARVLMDLGGRLEVILPSADYRATQVGAEHAPVFDAILREAAAVRTMPASRAEPRAYAAANDALLDAVDQLIAVWDGQPAGLEGGTASVVRTARLRHMPIMVIWPDGAQRG